MSRIAQLKHDLSTCLREINSANLVFKATAGMGPFGSGRDESLAVIGRQLHAQLSEQCALTANLAPGCEYFSLTRAVRALRRRTEDVRTTLDIFFEWAQNGSAIGSGLATEPSVPPSV